MRVKASSFPGRTVATVVRQQALQPGRGDTACGPDPTGTHENKLVDPVRCVQRQSQCGRAAV